MIGYDRLEHWFRSSNMPGGKFLLISTLYDWQGPDSSRAAFPVKRCARCGQTKDPLEFLTSNRVDANGYLHLIGGPDCASCAPPVDFVVQFDRKGRTCVRIEDLRDERGEPYRLFDKKSRHWVSIDKARIRRMKPLGNELRLQPYGDRAHDHQGRKYGRDREAR